MTDHPEIEDNDLLIEAALHLLDARKGRDYTYCLSCGEPIQVGESLICSECLADECDIYNKIVDLPEE
jgi:hypothetical protein